MRVFTIGHGTRPEEELVASLAEVGARTLVDVRRFPGSRRNPQFNRAALAATLSAAGIEYVHVPELGGRRTGEPGEERFGCIREAAFRSYAARMGRREWQEALAGALEAPDPCFMCGDALDALPPAADRGAPGRARPRGRPSHPAGRARAPPPL